MKEKNWRVKEIARFYDVDPKTVYAAVKAGVLESIRIGRSIRITDSALNAWITEQSTLNSRGASNE